MADKRSFQVYQWWMESAQKFDYFMAGICTALAGYLGQNFRPERLGWSPGLLELLSMLCFLGAVLASLRRIESTVRLLQINQLKLEKGEKATELADVISEGAPLRYRETLETVDRSEIQKAHASNVALVKAASDHFDAIRGKALLWYRTRTYLLVSGFLLLIAARAWAAYK